MANLPGLSYNPYTGLPTKKTQTPFPAASWGTDPGLGGQLGVNGSIPGLSGYSLYGNTGGASSLGLVPVVPGGPSAPGFTMPDFKSLLDQDKVYQQSLSDLGASHSANIS